MKNLIENKTSDLVNIRLTYFSEGTEIVVIEGDKEKSSLVVGFNKFKQSCNILTDHAPNTLFTIAINGVELDFFGGKFAPKTNYFIDKVTEKLMFFESDKKETKKLVANFILKDKDIVQTIEILNKLETYSKLELSGFATDVKLQYLNASNE